MTSCFSSTHLRHFHRSFTSWRTINGIRIIRCLIFSIHCSSVKIEWGVKTRFPSEMKIGCNLRVGRAIPHIIFIILRNSLCLITLLVKFLPSLILVNRNSIVWIETLYGVKRRRKCFGYRRTESVSLYTDITVHLQLINKTCSSAPDHFFIPTIGHCQSDIQCSLGEIANTSKILVVIIQLMPCLFRSIDSLFQRCGCTLPFFGFILSRKEMNASTVNIVGIIRVTIV